MIITETFKNGGKDMGTLLQEYLCLILKYKDEKETNDTNDGKRFVMETTNKMLCNRKENNV